MQVVITASGIQDYIFSISERQASKRLRGRSSRLGLVIDLCRVLLQREFGQVNVQRDAGSRLEVEFKSEPPKLSEFLKDLRRMLDRHSREDLDAQLWFAVAEGARDEDAYKDLAVKKLNLGRGVLQRESGWNEEAFVFTRMNNERALEDPEEAKSYPLPDAELGRNLARFDGVLITLKPKPRTLDVGERKQLFVGDYVAEAKPSDFGNMVNLELPAIESKPEQRISKYIARYAPSDDGGDLLDLDAIAKSSMGAAFLGVLKADLDNLGKTFEELSGNKTATRTLSSELESLFTEQLERLIKTPRDGEHGYSRIYVVYSGGDDLFLLGPWDKLIRFISEFQALVETSVKKWGHPTISLSAGVKLAHFKSPVRFLAEDVEEALDEAKGHRPTPAAIEPKNRIAVFERVLTWNELREALLLSDLFVPALKEGQLSTGFLQRFQYYASQFREYEKGRVDGLRMVPLLQNDWQRNRNTVSKLLRKELDELIKQLVKPMAEDTPSKWRVMDFASRFAVYAARSKEKSNG